MQIYPEQKSKDKPKELVETSYGARICKNIVQLPDGTWQYDRYDYNTNEYEAFKKEEALKEKQVLLDEIANLKAKAELLQENLNQTELAVIGLMDISMV
jgi:hypothetical protein